MCFLYFLSLSHTTLSNPKPLPTLSLARSPKGTDSTFLKGYLRRAEFNFTLGGKAPLTMCISDYEKVGQLQEAAGTDDDSKIPVSKRIQEAKVALKRAGKKDLYKMLSISNGATEAELKKAYKKSALKYHPDRLAGKSEKEKDDATAKFKEINEAYEILSDNVKRKRYDSGVDVEDLDQPAEHDHMRGGGGGGDPFGGMGGGDGMSGIDPEMLFQVCLSVYV